MPSRRGHGCPEQCSPRCRRMHRDPCSGHQCETVPAASASLEPPAAMMSEHVSLHGPGATHAPDVAARDPAVCNATTHTPFALAVRKCWAGREQRRARPHRTPILAKCRLGPTVGVDGWLFHPRLSSSRRRVLRGARDGREVLGVRGG